MKNIFWKKCHTLYLLYIGIGIIGIVIGPYEKFHIGILSVSADKKIEFIGLYRYRPIWKKAYRSYPDQGIHKVKMKVTRNEKRKKLLGFSFYINIGNFEAFLRNLNLSTKHLFWRCGWWSDIDFPISDLSRHYSA